MSKFVRRLLSQNISIKTLCKLTISALIVCVSLMVAVSFFNHPCYDDFGFSIITHDAWRESGSFLSVFEAAIQNTVSIRQTWEGTYATSFISTFQPALFGEQYYFVTTLVLLFFLLLSIALLGYVVLKQYLGMHKWERWLIISACGLLATQFVPSVSEAFYWFNGGVAYTLLWAIGLIRVSVWLALDKSYGKKKGALTCILLLLSLVMGGAKYSTVLFFLLVDLCFLIVWGFKHKKVHLVWLLSFVLMLGGLLFSATAPGNWVRADTLGGGVSAPMAVMQAIYFGLSMIAQWVSLPLLVVVSLFLWVVKPYLPTNTKWFDHPWLCSIVLIGLFCAQLTPTIYTGNYIGDGRVQNTYFYTYILLWLSLSCYWMGFFTRKESVQRASLPLRTVAIALVIACIGVIGYQPQGAESYGPQHTSAGGALRALISGQAITYDQAMDERHVIMNDETMTDVILTPIEDAPSFFMGDALMQENQAYVLSLYAEYYQKQSVNLP